MNKRLTGWIKPFATFGLALAILAGWIFVSAKYDGAIPAQTAFLVYFLFFVLIVEAASQADPDQVTSPINSFFARYSNRRDRIVIVAAYAVLVITLAVMPKLEGNGLLAAAVLIGSIAVFHGICLAFGTQELKEKVIPQGIQRFLSRKSIDKKDRE